MEHDLTNNPTTGPGSAVRAAVQAGIDPAYHRVMASRREQPTQAARDVLAERQRQIDKEGWAPEHDDEHDAGEMASAAACYVRARSYPSASGKPADWPWGACWWKPKDERSNLVRAAALLLAEIERIDRSAARERAEHICAGCDEVEACRAEDCRNK